MIEDAKYLSLHIWITTAVELPRPSPDVCLRDHSGLGEPELP